MRLTEFKYLSRYNECEEFGAIIHIKNGLGFKVRIIRFRDGVWAFGHIKDDVVGNIHDEELKKELCVMYKFLMRKHKLNRILYESRR